ncbi:hypothetical protein L3X38_038167 [Prunus dulcis]|uniref:Uncharacterized protein n=1 Tax=Prunus dulcis TaxID=3755 RepID=A0AAD4YRD7_PRUDU|nr:hypothetical protein L3X38_038167 [Prunus dulcis]
MARDAKQFLRKCDKYQRHAPLIRQPVKKLNPVVEPLPIAVGGKKWEMDIVGPLPIAVGGKKLGLDIVGPLPTAVGGKKFVLLAAEYFTKWVEVEAYKKVT